MGEFFLSCLLRFAPSSSSGSSIPIYGFRHHSIGFVVVREPIEILESRPKSSAHQGRYSCILVAIILVVVVVVLVVFHSVVIGAKRTLYSISTMIAPPFPECQDARRDVFAASDSATGCHTLQCPMPSCLGPTGSCFSTDGCRSDNRFPGSIEFFLGVDQQGPVSSADSAPASETLIGHKIGLGARHVFHLGQKLNGFVAGVTLVKGNTNTVVIVVAVVAFGSSILESLTIVLFDEPVQIL
mmetsp:Transcript_4979/g.10216  ORF Transcript_4979/g.10216 Transcript_4979/m.10216 type:complete len:241 (-) Transcript_4979:195-917(-)